MRRRELLGLGTGCMGLLAMRSRIVFAGDGRQMQHVRMTDGASIALEVSGRGPSLILVHGTGAFRASWDAVVPLLQNQFRIYAMDRRGHGESTDGSAYSLQREAEDLVRIAGRLPAPVFVLGHSFGGIVTLEALRLGNKFARAILYEPPVPVAGGIGRLSPEPVCTKVAAGDAEAALTEFFRDYARIPQPVIDKLHADPSWAQRLKLAPTLCRETTIVFSYQLDSQRFAGMATPALFLLGGASPQEMNISVRTAAHAVPHSQLHILRGQQHDAMFTAPKLLAQEISEFLLS